MSARVASPVRGASRTLGPIVSALIYGNLALLLVDSLVRTALLYESVGDLIWFVPLDAFTSVHWVSVAAAAGTGFAAAFVARRRGRLSRLEQLGTALATSLAGVFAVWVALRWHWLRQDALADRVGPNEFDSLRGMLEGIAPTPFPLFECGLGVCGLILGLWVSRSQMPIPTRPAPPPPPRAAR